MERNEARFSDEAIAALTKGLSGLEEIDQPTLGHLLATRYRRRLQQLLALEDGTRLLQEALAELSISIEPNVAKLVITQHKKERWQTSIQSGTLSQRFNEVQEAELLHQLEIRLPDVARDESPMALRSLKQALQTNKAFFLEVQCFLEQPHNEDEDLARFVFEQTGQRLSSDFIRKAFKPAKVYWEGQEKQQEQPSPGGIKSPEVAANEASDKTQPSTRPSKKLGPSTEQTTIGKRFNY